MHGQEEFLAFALQYLYKDLHFVYYVKSILRFQENYHKLLYIQLCFGDLVEPIPMKKAKIEEPNVNIFQLTPVNVIFFLATGG